MERAESGVGGQWTQALFFELMVITDQKWESELARMSEMVEVLGYLLGVCQTTVSCISGFRK